VRHLGGAAARKHRGEERRVRERHEPADLVAGLLGKPQRPVRSDNRIARHAPDRRYRELGDRAAGQSPEIVAGLLGEPKIAVGADDEALGLAVGCGCRELLEDLAARIDLRNLARGSLGEPDRAVIKSADRPGLAVGRRQWKFGDRATGRNTADLVDGRFGEP